MLEFTIEVKPMSIVCHEGRRKQNGCFEMRILDLCCAGGIGAIGYKMAAPDAEIVGWDVLDMSSRYPFEFRRGDALGLDYDYLACFDFIHASPPCQAYSKVTPAGARGRHRRLIKDFLLLCHASGKPFVIENVEGSGRELRPNLCIHLSGKRRYFNCSFPVPKVIYLEATTPAAHMFTGAYARKVDIARAWGIPDEYAYVWRRDMRQGIPPVMTRRIMELFLSSSYSG